MGKSWFHTLSFRVLVGSFVLLLILFGFYTYYSIHFYTEQTMTHILQSASRMSDVIKKSTHYSMLLDRREDVYRIITTIGKEPGVEGIRIYNKRGEITFSTDKQEEHSVVNMKTEACFICHDYEKPLQTLTMSNRVRIYRGEKGYRLLGLINPIRNDLTCSNAPCHAHPPGRTILGVLDVRMSLEQTDQELNQAQATMMGVAVVMIIVAAFTSVFFLFMTVVQPIDKLIKGTKQISTGNLDYQIIVRTKDELGELATSFNEMIKSLREEKEENRRWASTLQERIREKTEELQNIHSKILHIEKMTSLGKLSATVAHELNNPLEAILTYAKLIARRIKRNETRTKFERELLEEIGFIARETERCGNIVKNLLLFSKKQIGEFSLFPVKHVVEKAAELVNHHFTISNVQLRTQFHDENLTMICDENQLQQALVAMFVNAVEAMPDGGTLTVEVSQSKSNGDIIITISDTGVGIAPGDIPQIFEPFFTTKQSEKRVGLGLAVVYGIVERHEGKISVQSEIGNGTTFTLTFPDIANRTQRAGISELPIMENKT